ncbi:MAG: hypothetical protein QM831_25990 [Kofleriaceae bacterium]
MKMSLALLVACTTKSDPPPDPAPAKPSPYQHASGVSAARYPGTLATMPDHYELTNVGDGLVVSLTGGQWATTKKSAPIDLGPTHPVTVHVKTDGGAPVAGAVVIATLGRFSNDNLIFTGPAGGTTDATGTATFDVPQKPMTVVALHHDGWSSIAPLGTTQDLVIPKPGTLTGTATYDGRPESIAFTLKSPDQPELRYETNPDGTFTIAALHPGTWELAYQLAQPVTGGAGRTQTMSVTIEAGELATVKLALASATLVVIHTNLTDAKMIDYFVIDGEVSPATRAEAKQLHPQGGAYGGHDLSKDIQVHDVQPGKHTACINKRYADKHEAIACTHFTLMPGDDLKELTIEP